MIKINVLGAGTPAAITLATIIGIFKLRRQVSKIRINCIHDPGIPTIAVGESISPAVIQLICSVVNITEDALLNALDGTWRYGGVNEWEDGLGQPFTLVYGQGRKGFLGVGKSHVGMHANSEKLSKFLIDELSRLYPSILTVYHENVINVEQTRSNVKVTTKSSNTYESDYVIDCRGTPSEDELNSGDYAFPDFESVNSVIIFPDFTVYKEQFTQSLFHKNGWMFGVPLQHRKAFGYLYNRDITTHDAAVDHFKKLVPQVNTDKIRTLNWKHYYRKKAMDNRVLYLGNKLYFYEPAMGLPLHYYFVLVQRAIGEISGNTDELIKSYLDIANEINFYHTDSVRDKIQDLIAFNYVGKNNMDSDFWKQIPSSARTRLKSSENFKIFANNIINNKIDTSYFTHDAPLMKQYVEGYNIDLKEFL